MLLTIESVNGIIACQANVEKWYFLGWIIDSIRSMDRRISHDAVKVPHSVYHWYSLKWPYRWSLRWGTAHIHLRGSNIFIGMYPDSFSMSNFARPRFTINDPPKPSAQMLRMYLIKNVELRISSFLPAIAVKRRNLCHVENECEWDKGESVGE